MMAVDNVANRAALAAIVSPSGKVAFLMEEGREGMFEFQAGNYSGQIASDTLQGIYVASSSVSPMFGCWVRHWDGVNGRPEWFGAKTNDSAFNNLPALTACVASCPTTLLQLADYWIADTWVIDTSYRRIEGRGNWSFDTADGTRIILPHATKTIIRVGPGVTPGGNPGSDFTRQVSLSGMNLTRPVAVTPNSDPSLSATALRTSYIYDCHFSGIAGWESAIGFSIYATVSTKFDDCYAFRSAAGATSTNDIFYGFHCVGNPPLFSGAGGNASVYLNRCTANLATGMRSSLSFSSGFRLTDAFSDVFLTQPETVGCHRGISVVGTGSSGGDGSNIDLHISHAVIDQCWDFGLTLDNLAPGSLVELISPYVSLPSDGFCGIYAHAGGGNVSLLGGQVIGTSGGNTIGLFIHEQNGFDAIDLKIQNCPRPVIIDGSSNFRIEPVVNNPNVSSVGPTAAIFVVGSTRGEVNAGVKGKANAFAQGVYLHSTGNSKIDVRCTRLDPGCITGGAANKLVNNGTQITATGPFGAGHLASGIMS